MLTGLSTITAMDEVLAQCVPLAVHEAVAFLRRN